MKVEEEYRIQTEESVAWTNEFLNQRNILANEAFRIDGDRDERIRSHFLTKAKMLPVTQGRSKVVREIVPLFDTHLTSDNEKKVCAWVRDGWNIEDSSVRAEAIQAGNQSSTIFVFIPKYSADDIRRCIIDFVASSKTLEIRGVPNTPEGMEAYSAMETTRQTAITRLNDLLDETFSGAHVYQGGGNEVSGNNLQDMIRDASGKALQRLYPKFDVADYPGWGTVYSHAKLGQPDALKIINDDGDPAKNPVCKAILGFISNAKS